MSPPHHSLRTGRNSTTGQIYLITFTTAARQAHFGTWEIASDAARLMATSPCWDAAQLLAWVLMPDHWHGLIALGDCDLPSCVRRLKGGSARDLRQRHPRLDRVWNSAYHDHALRQDENLLSAARYVVMNPVRAGLVKRVGEYPFGNAIWL